MYHIFLAALSLAIATLLLCASAVENRPAPGITYLVLGIVNMLCVAWSVHDYVLYMTAGA